MSNKHILICAATAICTIGLAQTGGGSGTPTPAQGTGGAGATVTPPRAGGADIFVRPSQQREGVNMNQPGRANSPGSPLTPAGTVVPRPTTNPTNGGSATSSGTVETAPLPNAAAPGGAPIVTAPGGSTGFQNQPAGTNLPGLDNATPVRGEFGGPTDPSVDATPNPNVDASQIDVTLPNPANAQTAGGTLAPSTQPSGGDVMQPVQQQQRPAIPMPPRPAP